MAVPDEVPSSHVIERARRLGPLPYSALGRLPEPSLPAEEDLATWAAGALDEIWYHEGRPDPFTYVDVAAGDGGRARELLRLGPECLAALRIVLVDEDPVMRERQAEKVSIEAPALTLGPVAPSEDPDEGSRPLPGIGPLATSLPDLPVLASASVAVVAAYGWLSRQPSDRCVWKDGAWWEVRLGVVPPADDALSEILLPLAPDKADSMDQLAQGRFDGALYKVPIGAVGWLRDALGTAEMGWLLALDRWTLHDEPVAKSESTGKPADGNVLAGGGPSSVPLDPVPLDQLAMVRRPVDGPVPAVGPLEVVRWRLG